MKRGVFSRGWTLMEMMFVIAIIGLLSTAAVRWTYLLEHTRNVRRRYQLAEIQHLIELYYADNNIYPATGASANAATPPATANFAYNDSYTGGYAQNVTVNYVNNIVPTYYENLPQDPNPGSSTDTSCQPVGWQRNIIYISNGTNYKLIYHCAGEAGQIPDTDPLADPGSCFAGTCYSWSVSNNPELTATW